MPPLAAGITHGALVCLGCAFWVHDGRCDFVPAPVDINMIVPAVCYDCRRPLEATLDDPLPDWVTERRALPVHCRLCGRLIVNPHFSHACPDGAQEHIDCNRAIQYAVDAWARVQLSFGKNVSETALYTIQSYLVNSFYDMKKKRKISRRRG